MNEREIYEYLKKTSFIDVLNIILKQTNDNLSIDHNYLDTYYTAKDLYRLYPNVFSKYKLEKYIKNENLPVFKNGKDRLFLKSKVEEWLNRKSNSFFVSSND